MNGRRPSWAALAICAALVTTACAGGAAAPERPADTVVIAERYEPENLDPIFSESTDFGVKHRIFNGLLGYDQDLSPVPVLASELPSVSPDGKTVTVRLRQGVAFHDGVPVTADDVVFTYNAVLNPVVASGFRSHLDALRTVEALDPSTVRFTLSRVDPAFLDLLQLGIVPKHLLAGQDLNTAAFNTNPVGAGPYVFKEWRKGERLVLEANPTYFDGPAKIKRVVFVFVPDENAQVALMDNGTADLAFVNPRLAARLRDNAELRVVDNLSADARVLKLSNKNPALSDPTVRQAFSLAVDRQQMVDGVLAGVGAPAYGPIPAGHWASSPGDEVPHDPNLARRTLEAAGWRDGNGDGVRERNGTPLSFTLMYPAEDSLRKDLSLAVRQDLAKVGVDVKLEGLGFEAIYARAARDPYIGGYGTEFDPDLVAYELFHSRYATDDDPASNSAGMVNPRIDAALAASRATLDRAQRTESYRELREALREDGSYLFLVRLSHTFAVSNRVTGIAPRLEGHGAGQGVLWNLEDWQLTGARP